MDLLSEYEDLIMDEFIEGYIYDTKVLIKNTSDGNLSLYHLNSGGREMFKEGETRMLTIEVPAMGTSLNLAVKAHKELKDVYILEILQGREIIDPPSRGMRR